MKVFKQIFRAFCIGFLLAFLMQFFTMCPDSSSPTNPATEEPAVETQAMKSFTNDVKSAFQSGDKIQVMNLMYDYHKDIFTNELTFSSDKMQKFAAALESRKIIAANEFYAEYEIEISEQKFTIAYGNSGDGVWKLQRF